MGQCEKNLSMNMCLIFYCCWGRGLWIWAAHTSCKVHWV